MRQSAGEQPEASTCIRVAVKATPPEPVNGCQLRGSMLGSASLTMLSGAPLPSLYSLDTGFCLTEIQKVSSDLTGNTLNLSKDRPINAV